MRIRLQVATAAAIVLIVSAPALADDLIWLPTDQYDLFYDTATNWSPTAKTPTDADNLLFANLVDWQPCTIGAASQGNDVTVSAYDWVFNGGSGATLDTEGTAQIDGASPNVPHLTLTSGVRWDVATHLIVGASGEGSFTVQGNADVISNYIHIGVNDGSDGTVTVDGAGSTLTSRVAVNGPGLLIGHAGAGTLHVTGGGLAQTTATTGITDINLGMLATGEGTLNISGGGSRVISEDFSVGVQGAGHLNVSGGGGMDCSIGTSPDAWVASEDESSGDVTVTGDGSAWNMNVLRIGYQGAGTVDIEAGGLVHATGNASIAHNTNAIGTVTVTGSGTADSLLDVDGQLTVGHSGQATLNVEAGADVTVGTSLLIGMDAASAHVNQVKVTDPGSTITTGSWLDVGNAGKGELIVLNRGRVTASLGGTFGLGAQSEGSVTVHGTDSALIYGTLHVGDEGHGTLYVMGGGQAQATTALHVGRRGAGQGAIAVDGSDGLTPSTLHVAGAFYIGGSTSHNGGSGRLDVTHGGQVLCGGVTVGSGNGGADDGAGLLGVSGAGSLFNARAYGSGGMWVGAQGSGMLSVWLDGELRCWDLYLGAEAGTETAQVSIASGGLVDVDGEVIVGHSRAAGVYFGGGGQLVSGADDTSNAVIGYNSTANGALVSVDGVNAVWDHQGSGSPNHAIIVGRGGGNPVGDPTANLATSEWSLLSVTHGGNVLAHDLRVASGSSAGAGWVLVDGKDAQNNPSTVSCNGTVRIGDTAAGRLTVSGGGRFEETGYGEQLTIGHSAGGVGLVEVTGPGSTLSIATSFNVGYLGNGTLTVENGGRVVNGGHAWIANQNGANGSATIGDTGANPCAWNVGADLTIGGNGATGVGTLTVNPSGTVTLGSGRTLRLWGSAGGGSSTVNLDGGTMQVSDTEFAPGALFNFNAGTFRYAADATLDAPTLDIMLNGPATYGQTPRLNPGQHLAVIGTAQLSTPLRLEGGTFSVGSISAADIQNLEFDAGTFNLTVDDLLVGTTGLFGADPTVTAGQTVNITNNVTIESGNQVTIIGGYSSGGTTNNGDLIFVDPTGTGKTINGAIHSPTGSTLTLVGTTTFNDMVSGGGGIYGPGTAVFSGGYAPGDSTAQVQVEGNVVLSPANTLFIEIGGTDPGAEIGGYDKLSVAQALSLGGALDVVLVDGYMPDGGERFDLLDWGSVGGDFDAVALPTLSAGRFWFDDDLSTTGALSVLVRGDVDMNNIVDTADIDEFVQVLQGVLVDPYAQACADCDANGTVDTADIDDFIVILQGGAPGAREVPEPATVALMVLAAVAMMGRCRRR